MQNKEGNIERSKDGANQRREQRERGGGRGETRKEAERKWVKKQRRKYRESVCWENKEGNRERE